MIVFGIKLRPEIKSEHDTRNERVRVRARRGTVEFNLELLFDSRLGPLPLHRPFTAGFLQLKAHLESQYLVVLHDETFFSEVPAWEVAEYVHAEEAEDELLW